MIQKNSQKHKSKNLLSWKTVFFHKTDCTLLISTSQHVDASHSGLFKPPSLQNFHELTWTTDSRPVLLNLPWGLCEQCVSGGSTAPLIRSAQGKDKYSSVRRSQTLIKDVVEEEKKLTPTGKKAKVGLMKLKGWENRFPSERWLPPKQQFTISVYYK